MIAIADLGTNTFNLLIAEKQDSGMKIVYTEDRGVKLGQGGIEAGGITEEAFDRGINALLAFSEKVREYNCERFVGLGTSMLRNSKNGKEFARIAKEKAGIDIRIIKGKAEAELIAAGVRQAVEFRKKPYLIIDIGGGSVEFIIASKDAILWKHSFEVGTTRLLERIGMSDPITIEEQLRMCAHLDAQLGMLWGVIEKHHPNTIVGSAGSFDTLAEMVHLNNPSSMNTADNSVAFESLNTLAFTRDRFNAIMEELITLPRNERLSYPGLPEYRVDTIIPALLITDVVLQRGIGLIHWSRFSMKEGAAWQELV